jgi:hypothetical protein
MPIYLGFIYVVLSRVVSCMWSYVRFLLLFICLSMSCPYRASGLVEKCLSCFYRASLCFLGAKMFVKKQAVTNMTQK